MKPKTKVDLFTLGVIIAVGIGLFLRFYKFDTVPFGINHDGSAVAIEGIDLSQHPLPYRPFSEIDWKGETLFVYLVGFFIKFFGATPKVAKFASTFISSLLLPVYFLFVKELFNKKIGLLALLFLSFGGWHIIMGKSIWPASALPLSLTLACYFFLKTIKSKSPIFAIMFGLTSSLALNTYNAARIIPIFFACTFIFYLFSFKENLKKFVTPLIIFLFIFLVSIYPLANYAINHWQWFNSRSASVFIGQGIKDNQYLKPLFENIKKSALMFTKTAGGDDFFVRESLLDQPASSFFVLGILVVLFQLNKFPFQFVFTGLLIFLVPGMLSVPNGNRNIGTLPFVYLVAGLGLNWLYDFFKKRTKIKPFILNIGVLVIFLTYFFNTYHLYLGINRRELWGFYPETTIVGNFLNPLIETYDIYITDAYPRDALTFLTYTNGNPYFKNYTWLEKKEDFLKVNPKKKKIIFVLFDNQENRVFLQQLQNKFPNGKISDLKYINDNINRPAALIYQTEIYEKPVI